MIVRVSRKDSKLLSQLWWATYGIAGNSKGDVTMTCIEGMTETRTSNMRRLVPNILTMTANTSQGVKDSAYAKCDGPWQKVCPTEVYLEHVETLERRCGKKSSMTTYLSWLA